MTIKNTDYEAFQSSIEESPEVAMEDEKRRNHLIGNTTVLIPSGRFLLNALGEKVIELHGCTNIQITKRALIRAAAGDVPEDGSGYFNTGRYIREVVTNEIVASVIEDRCDAEAFAARLAERLRRP